MRMTAYQQEMLDGVIDDVGRIMRPNPSVLLDERGITRDAQYKVRGIVATTETLHEGLEMAAHALRRLESEYPDPSEFRRAAGIANRFLYSAFAERFTYAQPHQRAAAITLARAFLPLLAVSRDDVPHERTISDALRVLAPAMVLLPMHERIPEDDVRDIDAMFTHSNDKYRYYIGNYRTAIHDALVKTLHQPPEKLTVDGLTDFVSRVRQREEILQMLLEANTDTALNTFTVARLWSLYFLHLASFPHEKQRTLLKASVEQMSSWEPPSVRKAYYGATEGLLRIRNKNFLSESLYQRFSDWFARFTIPVLGGFFARTEEKGIANALFNLLETRYGIPSYMAVGLFAGERILSGDPPLHDIHRLQRSFHNSIASRLCNGASLDNDVFA